MTNVPLTKTNAVATREYEPINTHCLRSNEVGSDKLLAHQVNEINTTCEVSQNTLRRYDALHYWFNDPDGESGDYSNYETSIDRAAIELGEALDIRVPTILTNDDVPDWKNVRDNTTFITGHVARQPKRFAALMAAPLGEGCVILDMDDIHRSEGKCHYSVVYDLLKMEKESNQIIEQKLCEIFTTRQALNYIAAGGSDLIDIPVDNGPGAKAGVYTEHKWFLESKWLTDYLLENFSQFRCNFDTIMIIGAGKYIASDDINVNQLYRLMAKLGRINTHLIFVG